jgi:methylglutaconyl-CoA hydratase
MRISPCALPRTFARFSSTNASGSLIRARSIPAPHSGSIRVLGLNNPSTRNAISRALLAELTAHVSEIKAEGAGGPTRALILASDVDEAFCAGADLKERKTFTPQEYASPAPSQFETATNLLAACRPSWRTCAAC